MKSLNGPIPGQSLTNEPRNAPWERPPETSDPDEAIVHHLTRISDPKRLDSVLDGVGAGFPVSLITDLMLTGAVSQGVHSIDVSMMIAPVIHDYITNLLEEEGVEFKEFFDEDGDEEARDTIAISGALQGLEASSGLEVEEEPTMPQEPVVEEEPMEEPRGGGLMSRKEV
jgi:hypothetical protein